MNFNKTNVKYIIGILFFGIAFYLGLKNIGTVASSAGYIFSVASPFIIGAAIAFILNVPMSKIEYNLFTKHGRMPKASRPLSFIITLVLCLGVIGIAMYIIIPQIGQTMVTVGGKLPDAFQSFQAWVSDNMDSFKAIQREINNISISFDDIVATITKWAQSSVKNMAVGSIGAAKSVIGAFVNGVIGFVFSIYLLLSKEKLGSQCKQIIYAIFSEEKGDRIVYIGGLTSKIFSKFISGQCLEACILGLMFFVAMSILRMPYAMLIAVLIAFCALIPIVGAFIGLGVGILLILIESPMQALIFVILFFVLQQIEGNLVYPKVVGNSVGLPSIWVLVAVTLGGNLLGVVGMVLFIPVSSVCYTLFRVYIKDRLKLKSVSPVKWK